MKKVHSIHNIDIQLLKHWQHLLFDMLSNYLSLYIQQYYSNHYNSNCSYLPPSQFLFKQHKRQQRYKEITQRLDDADFLELMYGKFHQNQDCSSDHIMSNLMLALYHLLDTLFINFFLYTIQPNTEMNMEINLEELICP